MKRIIRKLISRFSGITINIGPIGFNFDKNDITLNMYIKIIIMAKYIN